MQFTNETDWDGRDLRPLIRATLEHEGVYSDRYQVIVKYREKDDDRISGRGWYNQKKMKLLVPRPVIATEVRVEDEDSDITFPTETRVKEVDFDTVRFAQVVMHEAGHNRGLEHSDMLPVKELDASHAEDYSVDPIDGAVDEWREKASDRKTEYEKAQEANYKIVCQDCHKTDYLQRRTKRVKRGADEYSVEPVECTKGHCGFLAELYVRDANGDWQRVAYGYEGTYVDDPQKWIDNPGELVA